MDSGVAFYGSIWTKLPSPVAAKGELPSQLPRGLAGQIKVTLSKRPREVQRCVLREFDVAVKDKREQGELFRV